MYAGSLLRGPAATWWRNINMDMSDADRVALTYIRFQELLIG